MPPWPSRPSGILKPPGDLPVVPDQDAVRFLQWALPRLGLRWTGFRKVRRQVRRRLKRRLAELGLGDLDGYRERLAADPDEWPRLDALCRITVSRFYRDRRVFEVLAAEILPDLARAAAAGGADPVRIWSAGCGAGEEPYTLAILALHGPRIPAGAPPVEVLGTDADAGQLERARRAVYPRSSARELPEQWRAAAFEPRGADELALRAEYRAGVRFALQDLRREQPSGPFGAILCRNLAFTYFDETAQRAALARVLERLEPAGVLVIGAHERLPEGEWHLARRRDAPSILQTPPPSPVDTRSTATRNPRRPPRPV